MEDYQKYLDRQLTEAGFDVRNLTLEQKELIMEPSDAPENYHQDGEITPTQALAFWKQKLSRSGLSPQNIRKAINLNT